MSFLMADLFGTTPALPGAAGGLVAAPVPGEGEAFAEALKTFRAQAFEGVDAAPDTGPKPPPQSAPAAEGQPVSLIASLLASLSPDQMSELDPEAVQRLKAGVPTEKDLEALAAVHPQLEKAGGPPPPPPVPPSPAQVGEGGGATDTHAAVAGTAIAAATAAASGAAADAAPVGDGNAEMALRIAEAKSPDVPNQPDKPVTSQAAGQAPTPELKEGRASAAGAPPAATTGNAANSTNKDSAKGDAPQVSRAVLAALAPRAAAITVPAASPEPAIAAPAMQNTAPAATQAAAPQTQLSPQAQAVAATPHVTSVQGSVTADMPAPANPAATPQTPIAPQAQAPVSPTETPVVTTAAAPAAGAAPATSAVPAPAPDPELAGGAATKENAADGALNALIKDKSEAKAETPQPKTGSAAAKEQEAAPARASAPEPDVKAKDGAKPEPQAPVKSASAEKSPAPEPRAPQPQNHTQQLPPVPDRVMLHDAAARAVQQTTQHLPAAAIPQIAGEMAARFRQGQSRFEIRLDPPELGRVDVRIEVDRDGHVHSRLMVEKSETLDLLKADQRALERALHEAGFKSDQNSLSFSLRDERGGNAKFDQQRSMNEMNVRTEPEDDPARLAAELAYRAPMRGPGGIDLRV